MPQANGDTYWVRTGSSPEFPYYAADGRLDNNTVGDVYLETINARYRGSAGIVWDHATESGTTPGEIVFEDGEYFQPTSALCADGLDITASNTGKVTITHSGFNYEYILSASQFTDYRSKITGVNLIMGGSQANMSLGGGNAKLFFDQCKLTDVGCPYGPVTSSSFRLGSNNHLSFKDTLVYFPNATAALAGYNMKQHEGKNPLWENSTFAIKMGSGNDYIPWFYGGSTVYSKNCIFYVVSSHYNSSTVSVGGQGESNIFYAPPSVSTTFTGNSNFLSLDPEFVDPSQGNFSLRPSSPLIGGLQTGNALANKHPNGVWVDHNHNPVQASHNYSLDSGDGTNYTFSGDATGTDPTLNANIQDTLTFTNNTGGHPLAIYNSQGVEVASESGGTTTFTPKYVDTYYYQCTSPGHQNMRGDIVVSQGTLGSYDNPFGGVYDAIDVGYYDNSATLLFKKGDHELYHQGYADISSAFPGGLFFVGEDSSTTRFTSGTNLNGYSAFYVSPYDNVNDSQARTPLTIDSVGFHINNNSGYINRGLFSGTHWKSFTLKSSKVTCALTGAINSGLFDYFLSQVPPGYEFNLSGCEINVPLSDNNGPGGSFLGGSTNIKYTVESCTFAKLDGYNYVSGNPSPIMVGGSFSSSNGSSIKNCIFYSNVGQDFTPYANPSPGVFSSCTLHSTTNSFTKLPPDMDVNSSEDPLLIRTVAGQEDLRLRPDSVAIGGLLAEPNNVYYLQPGNPYNGDGSQKDASSMTADGDPGPFNEFKEIVAAGVPYGSTVIILNGTYDWTQSFGRNPSTNVSSGTWYAYTCAGYDYVAETSGEVIFDAKLDLSNIFVYKPYGGTFPTSSSGAVGVFLDLHTTFTGIQFNNMMGSDGTTRNQISSVSGSAGLGSCTFKNCKFLGHINRSNSTYPWTGGGRNIYSSTMHWENCEISIAFDVAGGLLCGGDGFANDEYHGAWSWKNCTFYIPTGLTTFNGRNAANGTYSSPATIFGSNYIQNKRIFQNNIIHTPNGSASLGPSTANKLPQIKNNCFNGVMPGTNSLDYSDIMAEYGNLFGIDPGFVNQDSSNFKLRPTSVLVGKGL